jgi:hypothetical protein
MKQISVRKGLVPYLLGLSFDSPSSMSLLNHKQASSMCGKKNSRQGIETVQQYLFWTNPPSQVQT